MFNNLNVPADRRLKIPSCDQPNLNVILGFFSLSHPLKSEPPSSLTIDSAVDVLKEKFSKIILVMFDFLFA